MTFLKKQELENSDDFLQSFHSQYPGVTSKIFAHAKIYRGFSSYDLLSEHISDEYAPLTVLDLGCGDGFLLNQLWKRQQKKHHLIGVDMSEAEIHAAKKRLASQEVTLLCEKAHNLSLRSCKFSLFFNAKGAEVYAKERFMFLVQDLSFSYLCKKSNDGT